MSSRRGPGRDAGFGAWVAVLLAAYAVGCWVAWRRTLLPDEIRPLLLAAGPFSEQLAVARADLVQTPAAWVLARWWLDVFGQTDFAAKAFAMVLNMATLVLFSILARRVTRHWRWALVLAGLVFLRTGGSPNLVRMYGLVMLSSTAAMLLWDVWRERGGAGWLAGWVASMAVAVNAHALALLLLPAFVVATWLRGPRRLLFTATAMLPALSLVPWVLLVLPVYRERGVQANVQAIEDDPPRATAKLPFYLLSGEPPGTESPLEEFYIRHPVRSSLKWASLLLCLSIPGFSLAGSLRRRMRPGSPASSDASRIRSGPGHGREGRTDRTPGDDAPVDTGGDGNDRGEAAVVSPGWDTYSIVLTVVPVALLLAISMVWVPIITARYVLCVAPAFWLMLVIHGNRGGWPGRIALALVAAWMVASAGLSIRLNWPISPARIAATRVAAEHQANDLILIDRHNPLGWQFTWEWTRRLHRAGVPTIIDSPNRPPWLQGLLPGPMLDEFDPAGAPRVWFVHWVPGLRDRIAGRITMFGYREASYGEPVVPVLDLYVRGEAPGAGAAPNVDAATARPRSH